MSNPEERRKWSYAKPNNMSDEEVVEDPESGERSIIASNPNWRVHWFTEFMGVLDSRCARKKKALPRFRGGASMSTPPKDAHPALRKDHPYINNVWWIQWFFIYSKWIWMFAIPVILNTNYEKKSTTDRVIHLLRLASRWSRLFLKQTILCIVKHSCLLCVYSDSTGGRRVCRVNRFIDKFYL